MKPIPLTQGQVAWVDDEDFDALSRFRWQASRRAHTWYAERKERAGGSERQLLMHRVILAAPGGLQVDHIDGDGLNNTRGNLRLATSTQNHANRQHGKRGASGYRGVSASTTGRWRAYIKVHRKGRNLGTFDTPEEAARAYDLAAQVSFGAFARLNFPDGYDGPAPKRMRLGRDRRTGHLLAVPVPLDAEDA